MTMGTPPDNHGTGIALDGQGDAFVSGWTTATNFPTYHAYQTGNNGGQDAFVTGLNPSGSALVYSTYLGSSGTDAANAIAVDQNGKVYVTGNAGNGATAFPTTTGAAQTGFGGGTSDAFAAKLNPGSSGSSSLIYSTLLGGSGEDDGYGIAVDSTGAATVVGRTYSSDFPVVNPLPGGSSLHAPTNPNANDAFVAQLDPVGVYLIYSTYLG